MGPAFIRNLWFSFLQLFLNQGLAFLLFIFLSRSLNKEDFGLLNWSLALLLVIYSVLSFGMEQVLVRKIAEGGNVHTLVATNFLHLFFIGLIFQILLFILWIIQTGGMVPGWLLLLSLGKWALSMAAPFKSFANGKEHFGLLFFMSLTAGLVKLGCIVFFFFESIDLHSTILIFVLGDTLELTVAMFLMRKKIPLTSLLCFNKRTYFQLVKECLPQLGIVIFAIALARIDHILLGIFSSPARVAEYSVAYKIFEMTGFPLLVIAPLLVPAVSRNREGARGQTNKLLQLLRLEMIIACFTMMMLNLLWSPVVDGLTNGKYGSVNAMTIFILSLSLPFLYINNLIWTIEFTRGNLRCILHVFAWTFSFNLILTVILIPLFGNTGAAIAFTTAMVLQSCLYVHRTRFNIPAPIFQKAASLFSIVIAIILCMRSFVGNVALASIVAVLLFVLAVFFLKEVRLQNFYSITRIAAKQFPQTNIH